MEDSTVEFISGALIGLMIVLSIPLLIEGFKAWYRYMKDIIR